MVRRARVEPNTPEFAPLLAQLGEGRPGARSIVRVAVTRIANSCGFGVPRYRFEGERDDLEQWSRKKGVDGVRAYIRDKNAVSIDGLPAVDRDGGP